MRRSQSGHKAGTRFSTKNGAHKITNVKNTTPRTFVAFCSSRMILPCRELLREITLLLREWWLRTWPPEYLSRFGDDGLLWFKVTFVPIAPLCARIVAARRNGVALALVDSRILVLPAKDSKGWFTKMDELAGKRIAAVAANWKSLRECWGFQMLKVFESIREMLGRSIQTCENLRVRFSFNSYAKILNVKLNNLKFVNFLRESKIYMIQSSKFWRFCDLKTLSKFSKFVN